MTGSFVISTFDDLCRLGFLVVGSYGRVSKSFVDKLLWSYPESLKSEWTPTDYFVLLEIRVSSVLVVN